MEIQWGFPILFFFPGVTNLFLYLPKTSLLTLYAVQCAPCVSVSSAFSMLQTISVWVRDPRIQKNDFWHAYIDYEICLHVSILLHSNPLCVCVSVCKIFVFFQTDSVCFTKKISCVRRRYSEFVWLREKLQANALLM